MMKTGTKLILLTGVLSFTVGIVGLLSVLNFADFDSGLSNVDIEKKIPAADIAKLSIRTDVAAVNFLPGDSDEIKVHMTGAVTKNQSEHANILAEQVNDLWNVEAKVEQKDWFIGLNLDDVKSWFLSGDKKLKVNVSLPAKVYKEIQVSSNIGAINLGDIQAEMLNAQADTGRITLNSFKGSQLDLSTNTGAIKVKQAQGEIRLNTDTGSIDATLQDIGKSVTAKSDIGRIKLNFAKAPTSASFDLFTEIGRIDFTVPEVQIEEKENNRLIGKIGSGSSKITVATDTGSIEVSSGQ